MSFATTMIWFICTAVFVLLLLGLGFTAAAGVLHLPGSQHRAQARVDAVDSTDSTADSTAGRDRSRSRFHLRAHASH